MEINIGRFQIKKDIVKDLFVIRQSTAKGYIDLGYYFTLEHALDNLLSVYLLTTDTKEINSVETLIKVINDMKGKVYEKHSTI